MGKRVVIVAVVVVIGLMAAGLMTWSRKPSASDALRASASFLDGDVIDDEAARLVSQLTKHPAQPSKSSDKLGLYLLDIDRGVATLVVQEPAPGLTHCGSARWSSDGKRILFDATPGSIWNQTHLFGVDPGKTRPRITDLGPGNCPSPSPDGKQIAFLLNSGAVPDAPSGLWIMNADGSGRRPLGSYGRPYWSPDNRRLLIVSFSDPCELTLLDVEAGKTFPVLVPGLEVRSIPSWVNSNTIVAALGTADARTIALVDLTDPHEAKIKQVLRNKDDKPSVIPAYPVYSVSTQRCLFVNANPKGMSLYAIQTETGSRAKRVEPDGFDKVITDIALSPDGRHLVFCSDRRARPTP
jgi:Tol biopolymer transport system component